jgi:hypothetical protein
MEHSHKKFVSAFLTNFLDILTYVVLNSLVFSVHYVKKLAITSMIFLQIEVIPKIYFFMFWLHVEFFVHI